MGALVGARTAGQRAAQFFKMLRLQVEIARRIDGRDAIAAERLEHELDVRPPVTGQGPPDRAGETSG